AGAPGVCRAELVRELARELARVTEVGAWVASYVILKLEPDPAPTTSRDADGAQLPVELVDHARTPSTAWAKSCQSSRRSPSADVPRRVSRYTRRRRPLAVSHALASSPSASSRCSAG